MSGGRSGEFELIARFFAPLSADANAFNLRDDAALLDVSDGHQLVITTDALVAGVHFRAGDPPELVAAKALRVNLSDLAAKGARPRAFFQALALNESIDDDYLQRYAAGLAADVKDFAIPLAGGDTTATSGPFTIAITAVGEVPRGQAILRSGARPGDVIYVTGTLGDAALGLDCLENRLTVPPADQETLVLRYHLPQPRMKAGAALRGIAGAALDVSDGLLADAAHMAAASGVAIQIEREKIPLSPAAAAAVQGNPLLWERITAGGDDYEILFAVPPAAPLEQIARESGVPLTAIGVVIEGAGVTLLSHGKAVPVSVTGYRHR